MSYEFAGSLYDNIRDAEMANVKTFLLADGNTVDVDDVFDNIYSIAHEMAEHWSNVEGSPYTVDEAHEAIARALLEIMAENANEYLWQASSLFDLQRRLVALQNNPYYDKNKHKEIDHSDLPIFGNNEPADTQGILSYSDECLLTSDLSIMARDDA